MAFLRLFIEKNEFILGKLLFFMFVKLTIDLDCVLCFSKLAKQKCLDLVLKKRPVSAKTLI